MNTKIEIKKLSKNDLPLFIDLIHVFEEVFEMKNFVCPEKQHLQNVLEKEDFHAFVATQNNKVIGGLTVYTLHQYYSLKPLAYIYDLAVLELHQRKGIGQQLIENTRGYFSALGYEEVFVQADKVDEYALDFYRKTKPSMEEDVSHFYYLL